MQKLRVFQPYGANLRFIGVTNVQVSSGAFLRFNYQPLDEKGEAIPDTIALALFNLAVISGYSLEGPDEKILVPDKSIVVP